MYRVPAISELDAQGVKFSTSCSATEGHTTGQGTEIEYMHRQLNGIECKCMCREQV